MVDVPGYRLHATKAIADHIAINCRDLLRQLLDEAKKVRLVQHGVHRDPAWVAFRCGTLDLELLALDVEDDPHPLGVVEHPVERCDALLPVNQVLHGPTSWQRAAGFDLHRPDRDVLLRLPEQDRARWVLAIQGVKEARDLRRLPDVVTLDLREQQLLTIDVVHETRDRHSGAGQFDLIHAYSSPTP